MIGFGFSIYSKNVIFYKRKETFRSKQKKIFEHRNIIKTSISMIFGGGNGGKKWKGNKNFEWSENRNNNFLLMIFFWFILLFAIVNVFSFYKKNLRVFKWMKSCLFIKTDYQEIVLKNCELIPVDFICFNFKSILNNKNYPSKLHKIFTFSNRWYKEKNYLLSAIRESKKNFSGNLQQIIFFGNEPKIKNIKIKEKSKTNLSIISNLIKLNSGDYFKWYNRNWENFCNCGLFLNTNFSVTLIKTKNDNMFLDLVIDFNEKNTLIIQPGITIEKKAFSGTILAQSKNLLGEGINFKSNVSKTPQNDFFFTSEINKLIHPLSNIFILYKKFNQKKKGHFFKISKIFGLRFKEKFEIFYSNIDKNSILAKKKNHFLSNISLTYLKTIKLKKNSKILLNYYIAVSKKNEYLKAIGFGCKINYLKKVFFLSDNFLCPKIKVNTILKISRNILGKKISFQFYSDKCIRNLSLYKYSSPFGFYLDLISSINKTSSFFIFIDIDKCLKKNLLVEKSFGLGLKLNNTFKIYSKINWNGQIKVLIDSL